MTNLKDAVERALLDDLRRQNPDMTEEEGRETVWLSGGCTPQSRGTFINVHDLAEAVLSALSGGGEAVAWRERCVNVEKALSNLARAARRVIEAREAFRSPDRRQTHPDLVLEEAEAWVALQACFDNAGDVTHPVSDGWQGMETAPKGPPVDLWVYFPEIAESRRVPDAFWNSDAEEWQLGQYHAGQYTHRPQPIAWMPLPSPPEAG